MAECIFCKKNRGWDGMNCEHLNEEDILSDNGICKYIELMDYDVAAVVSCSYPESIRTYQYLKTNLHSNTASL